MTTPLINILTVTALLINTIALLVVVWQTHISKQSLAVTKKSIDDAKTQRQLEILPKFTWVIRVQVKLEHWKKELEERKNILQNGVKKKNDELFKQASDTKIKSPKDLSLDRVLYNNMPSWLRELWISGAQYYYDAIAPLPYVYKDGKPNYDYAQSWIKNRSEDSIRALSKLLEYLEDMIPPVILNTPASLSDEDFLRD
ncbi:hypothetical protein KAR91_23930 [Candidatus Pacearchaeota archaeon]|nr:hypothetical protein [Candidatus Pacearchaeota archaeon]